MKQRQRHTKDKKVRAFKATPRVLWGFERVVKTYSHSENSGGWWAHLRHLNQSEQHKARQVQSNESVRFVFSYNPKITTDLYLEFGERTYKIVSIDPYEYNKTDLEVRAEQVSPPTYDEVEWEDA